MTDLDYRIWGLQVPACNDSSKRVNYKKIAQWGYRETL